MKKTTFYIASIQQRQRPSFQQLNEVTKKSANRQARAIANPAGLRQSAPD
jgi:hypothetical protein